MKLKDIADMKDYLENRCYCPNEIYDSSGFFFNTFPPETECEILIEGERNSVHGTFVLATSEQNVEQIIYIDHKEGYVENCERFDATENNKAQIIKFMRGEIDGIEIDTYEKPIALTLSVVPMRNGEER